MSENDLSSLENYSNWLVFLIRIRQRFMTKPILNKVPTF